MIHKLQFIQSVGTFPAVASGAQLPFEKLSLMYADNARGKSTIAALFRSLSTGDSSALLERQRLGSSHPPRVVIECSGLPTPAVFQNGTWNRKLPEVMVFDEQFVSENVCSGLTIENTHRQNLHEFIIGSQGVLLSQALQRLVDKVEEHIRALRIKSSAIPSAEMGGLSIDQFCALTAISGIDAEIAETDRSLKAAREKEPIEKQLPFDPIVIPVMDIGAIESLLAENLPGLELEAEQRVRAHLKEIGPESEGWVAEGMTRLSDNRHHQCPFCAQDASKSDVIGHYQAYFSDAYRDFKRRIATAYQEFESLHSPEVPTVFERNIRIVEQRSRFWSSFCEVPSMTLDTASIVDAWRAAREQVRLALQAKAASPLEKVSLSADAKRLIAFYEGKRNEVGDFSLKLASANTRIALVKQGVAVGDMRTLVNQLARLKAVKARHSSPLSNRCDAYLAEKEAKTRTESERDAARAALNTYRSSVFPTYQAGVNRYLAIFNATFSLSAVQAVNSRTGTSCAYSVVVNNVPIPVGGASVPGQPAFRTVLSAGDRNTLALAFFFASLDADPGRPSKVVVIDDPVSSLDDNRALTTVHQIRALADSVGQIIVLSHSKQFLCRIWEHADPAARCALQVSRDQHGSTIEPWDISNDSITEHDRRHSLLRTFSAGSVRASSEIARAIRPSLEAFFRVAFPEFYPPGTLLGNFRNTCDQRVGTPNEILDATDIRELREIVEYANRFHHDTNPSWETAVVNDGELLGFVNRALKFTRRK